VAATEAAYPVAEDKTVYTYLAGLFNIRKALLEFIIFCIPAVFYDILAALAVNTILSGVSGGKDKQKTRKEAV
jgi:hypothetical protein